MKTPAHIVKVNRYFYRDSTNGRYIHKTKLQEYIEDRKKELNTEAKDETIRARRYDLRYD